MNKCYLVCAVLLVTTACTTRQKIMDASLVSMTHTHIPEGGHLQTVASIESRFCPSSADRGNIGLFDQAVKGAQTKHNVDYISNATFWRENNCIILEGTGQKLISESPSTLKLQKN